MACLRVVFQGHNQVLFPYSPLSINKQDVLFVAMTG